MENFLLKVIDENGEEVFTDKQQTGRSHNNSFDDFAKLFNIEFRTRNRTDMALQIAKEKKLTTIFNVKVGYLFVLPEICTELLINYLENNLSLYQEEEENGKIIEVRLFSSEPVYYNHKHYRDLITEEKIAMLEGKKQEKSLVTELLKEELARQKEALESKRKWLAMKDKYHLTKEENINEFNILLTEYYNTDNKDKIISFVYDKYIFWLELNNT